MNKNKILIASTALLSLAAVSCHDTIDFEAARRESIEYAYSQDFKSRFGEPDPEQDYNMASRVMANLTEAFPGAAQIKVFSAMPGAASTSLIADFMTSNSLVEFDVLKGEDHVFIQWLDEAGFVLHSTYASISNGQLILDASRAATRANGCPIELGVKVTDLDKFNDDSQYFKDIFGYQNPWDIYGRQRADIFDMYHLVGVESTLQHNISVRLSDIDEIVGNGGVFAEQGKDAAGHCNKLHWEEDLKPSLGAEYVIGAGGSEFTMTYMYGGTVKKNKFGYLYYKDGASEKDILSAPRYLLMEDASPQSNVLADGKGLNDGMQLPGIVQYYDNYQGNNVTLTGTTYRLAYFGVEGKDPSSYVFPEGTHIVFFEIIDGGNKANTIIHESGGDIRYSLPWMNKRFYYNVPEGHDGTSNSRPAQDFVTYSWGGQIILGMEDEGGDDDMNDILFFVNGKVQDPPKEIGQVPESQSWLLACEDMGAIGDYDFNDVVFKVAHVAGQNTITFTPLAAGGTLGSVIYRNNERIGEIHMLLDNYSATSISGSFPMLATQRGNSITGGKSITYTLPDSEVETFTMSAAKGSTIAGGFQVKVVVRDNDVNNDQQDGEYAAIVTAKENGAAPQMLILPGNWIWPTERTHIDNAYPRFTEWVQNAATTDWASDCRDQLLVQPYQK